MRRAINTSVRLFAECFSPSGPVVEVGSLCRPGYEELCILRPYFKGLEYIGCDMRQGLNVDRIEDAQQLSFDDESVGTVLLCEILEHLPHPQKAIAEVRRVLRNDGLLALSVPFHYRLHGFPTDYWRFTASGVYTLISDFPGKVVFSLGPRLKPAFIFAVAAKSVSEEFTEKIALFHSKVCDVLGKSRLRGHISVFKERARDFFGHLLGRAELAVEFFDPAEGGGYGNLLCEPGRGSPADCENRDTLRFSMPEKG